MKIRSILAAALILAGLAAPQWGQRARGIANAPREITPSGPNGGGGNVPTNSPEPLTMIALGTGAAIAGGAAYRRRKRKQA